MIIFTLNQKTIISFILFGLLNNILYVVILNAAIDLVGPTTPKATVLLADVLPSFIIKTTAPFYIHIVPYKWRIFGLIALSFGGMIVIGVCNSVLIRLAGVVMASTSSGLGEYTFLQLTHHYDSNVAMNGFSIGTGMAGLCGSFLFMALTAWLQIEVRKVIIGFSLVPFLFLWGFFVLLPDRSLQFTFLNEASTNTSILDRDPDVVTKDDLTKLKNHFKKTLQRIKPLVIPFMIPLFTVYMSEYMINQGISPTLLFPKEEIPFDSFRDVYVTYGTLYQLGVFISRSSAKFIRIKNVYIPSILQLINLIICLLQAFFVILPNIYIIMLLIFYEGLLGGASYVNTFLLVSEIMSEDREFAMGAVGISDSAGIVMAALLSLYLEPGICKYQISHDRPWCEMH